MFYAVRFLRSAVATLTHLTHALISRALLMSLFSPTSPTTTTSVAPAPCWQQQLHPATTRPAAKKQVHVHQARVLAQDDGKDQYQQLPLQAVLSSSSPLPAPGVVVPEALKQQLVAVEKTAKAPRGRPPRLAIPPPVACAPGVDPFRAAADRETDVVTELEVQGEGFCLASRRGVRHAMEDWYGVITDHSIGGGSKIVNN